MAAQIDDTLAVKATFEGWKYKHYFTFMTRKDKNIYVRCRLCPNKKMLSPGSSPPSAPPSKQPRLAFQQGTSKSEVNRLVASYIVEEMLPFSTVESPSFRNILSKIAILGNGQPPSDRKTQERSCVCPY